MGLKRGVLVLRIDRCMRTITLFLIDAISIPTLKHEMYNFSDRKCIKRQRIRYLLSYIEEYVLHVVEK